MIRPLYVVEYVGWNPTLLMWLTCASLQRAKVVYAAGQSRLVRWWRQRYPDGAFEEFISEDLQKREGHVEWYKVVERRAQEIGRSVAARRLQRLLPHPQMDRTLRRALRIDGFEAWLLSLDVERRRSAGASVKFFPARRRAFLEDSRPAAWRAVPWSYRVSLTVTQWFRDGALPLALAFGRVIRMVKTRGVISRPPRIRAWGIAQKIGRVLPTTFVADHELIFADGMLHPSRILHLADSREVLPEVRAYFQTRGSPLVCVERLRVPLAYVLKRVCRDFLFGMVVPCGIAAMRFRRERDLFRVAVRIGWQIISCEIFAQHHRPRVYVSWDTYDVLFSVRTMVWERTGTRCVGYIHASPTVPLIYYHGLYAHVLLVAGPRIREMFGDMLSAVGRVLPVGHLHTELALGTVPAPSRAEHRVAAFDSSFSPIFGLTTGVFRAFYLGLVRLAEAYPQVTIVLKRKNPPREDPNPAYTELEVLLERHPRLRVVYEAHTYTLLAQADSVVALAASTVGIEALACRRPAVAFDPRPNYADNPLWRYDPFLVCHTAEDLIDRYRRILAGAYPAGLMEAVVRQESAFYEERPLSRLRQVLLEEAGAGAARDDADEVAAEEKPVVAGALAPGADA